MDQFWTLIAAFLVFFMQAGFGMLEVGTVRVKNMQNILIKNMVDAAVGGITFWAIGYGFAFGQSGATDIEKADSNNGFIGNADFFLINDDSLWIENGYSGWVFQWAFVAAASTIVCGAVAERTKFIGYLIYTFFISAIIYPIVVKWAWGGGWLSDRNFRDFAGSGVVHMTGGTASLMGAIVIGPRMGRMKAGARLCGGDNLDNEEQFQPSSPTFQALGTLILWFGWYGFNPGSTTAIYSPEANNLASLAAINTTLAASAATLTCVAYQMIISRCKTVELGSLLNCSLAGLVGITAGCACMRPWSAVVVGILAVPIYFLASNLLKRLKIDDPLDAAPVHCFCGMWGCLAVGIFADCTITKGDGGLCNDTGELFAIQLAGIAAIFAWVAFTSFIVFFVLMKCDLLRVSQADELRGLDVSHHGALEDGSAIAPVKKVEDAEVELGNKA